MKTALLQFLICFSFLTSFTQNKSLSIYRNLHYCKLTGVKDSVLCGIYPVFENRETQSIHPANYTF